MLAIAQHQIERAALSALVTLVQADLCNLALEHRFKLAICAQNTFCHMLSTADQLRLLRAVGHHLEPGGLLALDVFNPDPIALVNNDRRLTLMSVATDPVTGHTLTQTLAREIDVGEQIEHVTTFVDELDGARLVGRRVFEFDLRYVFRFELELLLDKAGFELEALYGSYDLEPFHGESERLLAVAKWGG
jgi:SAM-dependent methyltransferase